MCLAFNRSALKTLFINKFQNKAYLSSLSNDYNILFFLKTIVFNIYIKKLILLRINIGCIFIYVKYASH